jgi:esterase/lipase superfamily enzyme
MSNVQGTSIVPILVATTRNRATTSGEDMFDIQSAGQLSYASIRVSMPPDTARKIGEVQWPASSPGDPQQSFVTVSADYLDKQPFVAAVSVGAKQGARGKVLVFVHGFNNRFDEAVYRFAQIVHDSKAPAIPILFSWPSHGVIGLRAYQDDLESAANSREALEQLLETIAASPNVKEITVLCHSMGCLPTLAALRSKAAKAGKIGGKIKNVMLVAPDVDVHVFRAQMQEMGSSKPRFALFLSQDDHALKLSKAVAGGITRLGDVDPDQEPYKTDFRRDGFLVFDLTGLRGNAHSRAFDEVTSVMGMIETRLAQGQQIDGKSALSNEAQ